MKTRWLLMVLGMVILVLLAGCSGSEESYIDASDVEVRLTTDPPSVKSGEVVALYAALTGVPTTGTIKVTYEIKVDGKSKLIDAKTDENGEYMIQYKFPRAGQYDVYVHYYRYGEHVTKLVKLDVAWLHAHEVKIHGALACIGLCGAGTGREVINPTTTKKRSGQLFLVIAPFS